MKIFYAGPEEAVFCHECNGTKGRSHSKVRNGEHHFSDQG